MHLQRAIIFVKDIERMASFYGETLGLRAVKETRTSSWVEFPEGVALHAIPSEIAQSIEIASPPRVRETNPIKLVFGVADVDKERSRLEALGVRMIVRPWGTCDGIDPEGNVFQIFQLLKPGAAANSNTGQ